MVASEEWPLRGWSCSGTPKQTENFTRNLAHSIIALQALGLRGRVGFGNMPHKNTEGLAERGFKTRKSPLQKRSVFRGNLWPDRQDNCITAGPTPAQAMLKIPGILGQSNSQRCTHKGISLVAQCGCTL